MVNFGPQTAEIGSGVWGTPANFNGFRVLAALLHGTLSKYKERPPSEVGRRTWKISGCRYTPRSAVSAVAELLFGFAGFLSQLCSVMVGYGGAAGWRAFRRKREGGSNTSRRQSTAAAERGRQSTDGQRTTRRLHAAHHGITACSLHFA